MDTRRIPRLLDLYCGAGGAAAGYTRAGFDVVGVDHRRQPRYPFAFILADALDVLSDREFLARFDVVHASPPCQAYSDLRRRTGRTYPRLVEPSRRLLRAAGGPYVIENVDGAPLENPVVLCGTMFPGLRVIRHRLFESSVRILAPAHSRPHPLVFTHDKRKAHHARLNQNESFVQVTGGGNCTIRNARDAMGIDWMTKAELNEAVPPAYTHWIGRQLIAALATAANRTVAVSREHLQVAL